MEDGRGLGRMKEDKGWGTQDGGGERRMKEDREG